MRRTSEKAFAVSAAGHVVLLVVVFQVSQWRPVPRGYPRTISAVLIPKKGTGPAAQNPLPAGASAAVPAPPAVEKAAVTPPPPARAPERVEKKTPIAISPQQSPAPKASKNSSAAAPSAKSPAPATSGSGTIGAGRGGGAKTMSGGVARVDGPEFPFPHYLALLQFRIENQWQPAYLGTGEFLATVHFVVAKSGKILLAEIEQSSNNFSFDQAALRAVQNANPLPALPDDSGMESLSVHFDFVANW